MRKNKFITLEGVDGCGKSTQTKLLLKYLEKQQIEYIYTREPGGTDTSEALRKVLLDKDKNIFAETELLIVLAARVQHIKEIIVPALGNGKWVVCDRFSDATIAYQGYGGGLDLNYISKVFNAVSCNIEPDITFFIDIDINQALKRVGIEKDRFESKGVEFYEKVRAGYLALAKENPERIFVIDGEDEIEKVHERVISCMVETEGFEPSTF